MSDNKKRYSRNCNIELILWHKIITYQWSDTRPNKTITTPGKDSKGACKNIFLLNKQKYNVPSKDSHGVKIRLECLRTTFDQIIWTEYIKNNYSK